MRRGIGAVALVVVILAGVGIGVGAYRAGERSGVTQGIEQVHVAQQNGQEIQIVHVLDGGRGAFFPGFLLFPFFLIGAIVLIRGASFWGPRRWDRAHEWHRHEHGDPSPPAPTAPAA